MKRLWIVGLLVMGAAAATPTSANADWRVAVGISHDRDARGAGPAFRYGYDRGWREARWDYTAGFRQGYQAGYRRAFAAARPGWRERGRERERYPNDDRYGRRYDNRYEDDRR
jgi:hypothetical protein